MIAAARPRFREEGATSSAFVPEFTARAIRVGRAPTDAQRAHGHGATRPRPRRHRLRQLPGARRPQRRRHSAIARRAFVPARRRMACICMSSTLPKKGRRRRANRAFFVDSWRGAPWASTRRSVSRTSTRAESSRRVAGSQSSPVVKLRSPRSTCTGRRLAFSSTMTKVTG